MKQTKLLLLAGGIAMVGFGCYTHHDDHRDHRLHEPAGAIVVREDQRPYTHYEDHGVGRQYHRHYYRDRH